MRFQFIGAHRAEFPVRRMCAVLEVSPKTGKPQFDKIRFLRSQNNKASLGELWRT